MVESAALARELGEKCSGLQKTVTMLEEKIARQKVDGEGINDEADKLRNTIDALEARNKSILSVLAQRERELEAIQFQLSSKAREVREVSLLCDSMRQSLAQKDCQLENLEDSWSLKL